MASFTLHTLKEVHSFYRNFAVYFDKEADASTIGGLTMSVFYLADKKHMIEVYGDEALPIAVNGEELKAIAPNTVDAAKEKHVPVATYDAAKNEVHVSVGSVAHPMTEEHLIEYIILVTKKGVQRVDLTATDTPEVTFRLMDGDTPVKVLEYCNLHGLWQAEF